jgi:hypothetical protein
MLGQADPDRVKMVTEPPCGELGDELISLARTWAGKTAETMLGQTDPD